MTVFSLNGALQAKLIKYNKRSNALTLIKGTHVCYDNVCGYMCCVYFKVFILIFEVICFYRYENCRRIEEAFHLKKASLRKFS